MTSATTSAPPPSTTPVPPSCSWLTSASAPPGPASGPLGASSAALSPHPAATSSARRNREERIGSDRRNDDALAVSPIRGTRGGAHHAHSSRTWGLLRRVLRGDVALAGL